MKHIKYILAAAVLAPQLALAQSDDFGMDFNIGAEKKLCRGIGFSIDAEARTQDNTRKIERWDIGGSVGVKIYNTQTLDVKASLGWEYIWQNRLSECKEKYEEDEYMTPDGPVTETYLEGWNTTNSYWRKRHRTSIGLSASYKPNKRWTLSLKETFQYNHYCKASTTVDKYRLIDEDEPESGFKYDSSKDKDVKAKDRSILRSKLTVQYDIKHSPFDPYASVDYGCGMNYTANKWKFTAGTDIKIDKKNTFNVFYRFQTEDDDDEPNGHLLGMGYKIKF